MHRTITGILRKIREIEALSMGVETLRGYNLDRPPVATQKPGITNKRQFSSNSPMRFGVKRTQSQLHRRASGCRFTVLLRMSKLF